MRTRRARAATLDVFRSHGFQLGPGVRGESDGIRHESRMPQQRRITCARRLQKCGAKPTYSLRGLPSHMLNAESAATGYITLHGCSARNRTPISVCRAGLVASLGGSHGQTLGTDFDVFWGRLCDRDDSVGRAHREVVVRLSNSGWNQQNISLRGVCRKLAEE